MIREFVCVVCPRGCLLEVKGENAGKVTEKDISGYKCKRGLSYAFNEYTNPVRSLTTTVRINGGCQAMAPVKSAAPLPKDLLFECMKVINSYTVEAPVRVGDVLIKNILGTGIDIISTANVMEGKTWTSTISSHLTRVQQVHGL